MRQAQLRLGRALRAAVLCALAVLFLVPFYLLVRNGLADESEITAPGWTFLPRHLRLGNIGELFADPAVPMAHALWNSTVIAVLTTAGTLLLASLAGYGLARIPYPHAQGVFYAILGTLMVPAAVTFVPTFVLVSSLGWVSSLRGLVVPTLFNAFAAFVFRQFFLGFPHELEDAARVDGLGYWRTYWRVVVPNSGPAFAAVGAIVFIGSWNAFLWPLVIGQDQRAWTVQVALSTFTTAQNVNLHELFTAAAVSIVPLIVVFVGLQRFIVAGVERSGIDD
ncbi:MULTISPECIES: carbohydrate ABC transporter permease [Streptomycetaceae]|uniref:Sugar ABC transporter permeases protein n=1 Tax=Streptantibioticus cattleyicolor (strain ATCC 35852 / DSM 46488 / JCM 4925 / NBRC 14057 / NRRL 8057) TaxID=1003195 RepID=F8JNY6_STREN|nr:MULTISPECIES: carbohydrate ABC transporter permease [Streptomycetaceae]AEW93927.1 sugar ABC transporter permeases protein [Streptantibioticus cattleyicolor NRRL 8057 = DSM 46488]MYS58603.1 ABC transporter permease subunit [Streptomyces sp. SID5468]CCB74273.1 Carbohydrate ABC transporter membrane protein 2, CUT1 family [Streptantibioticus cattleyicolor NRRL 8057 = DSM 46488]